MGKVNILSNYTTIAIRYESFDQIEIFFYNYNSSGVLLSCFLAASNEKDVDWDTKTGHASKQSLMTATINADNTISVLTEGDFMINQTFQLTADGHFRVIDQTSTEYSDN